MSEKRVGDESVMTYVGRKRCGCAVAAMVDTGEHPRDLAKEIASWVRHGWTVENRTVGWVRHTSAEDGGLQFDCPHEPKKARRAEKSKPAEQLSLESR